MKRVKNNYAAKVEDGESSGELLILPDGRILAHNISPEMAAVLTEIDPGNEAIRRRSNSIAFEENDEVATGD